MGRPPGGFILLACSVGVGVVALLAGCGRQGAQASLPDRIAFNQHIRPIFTANCTACHGGVKKAGGVSFVYQDDVKGVGDSGKKIVVPGDPGSSELIRRISSTQADYRMPPADHAELSSREIALFTRWIEQGAPWEEHWAYVRPQPQPVPKVEASAWVRSDVDAFVLTRLEEAGLQPEPEQDKARLLRRVALDLTGLPPTPEELDSYVADARPDAYERVVDRLLASPHFGERWASPWLDLARYADTQGFERDRERQIWAYRDWVIRALNADVPFDQFTIQQTAGDLRPDPQPDDLIATAFHRNSMTNAEGGTDDEEFRIVAAIDRVNTTWQAWMGTTFACTQCHSHPYDPFPHESYYRFLDFFNNTADHDTPDEFPTLVLATSRDDEETLFRLQRQLAQAENDYAGRLRELSAETAWAPLDYSSAASTQDVVLSVLRDDDGTEYLQTGPDTPRGTVHTVTGRSSKASQLTALRLDALMPPDRSVAEPADPFIVSLIEVAVVAAGGTETSVKLTHAVADEPQPHTAPEQSLDRNPQGWGAYPKQHYPHWAIFAPARPVRLPAGASLRVTLHHTSSHDGAQQPVLRRFRLSVSDSPAWTETVRSPAVVDALARRTQAQTAIEAIATTSVPVLRERPQGYQRETHVFTRGDFLNKGEQVTAGVPALLNPLPQTDRPDRMALARWLVAPENPLTARVAVNRFWAQLFGLGIVETLEDFGSAGLAPTHPELLDYLALRFQNELGWSVKRLLRELVTSATYRQASTVSREKLERDPRNQLLSRGPRQRLTAEMTRDNALAVSGLLSRKQFGPPVMPPQPEGIWRSAYNSGRWETSAGEDRYRRAVYTFLKRATPYPSFATFDLPSRDICVARRIPTNTPLQALVTLNDPVYVEAAQHLARWARGEGVDGPEAWIRRALRRALLREPQAADVDAMVSLYRDALQHYTSHPDLVTNLAPSASEAALTVVTSAMMNLDEFLTR